VWLCKVCFHGGMFLDIGIGCFGFEGDRAGGCTVLFVDSQESCCDIMLNFFLGLWLAMYTVVFEISLT
jgi:hypothetical protein